MAHPAPAATPTDDESVDHGPLATLLDHLRRDGMAGLTSRRREILVYRDQLTSIDPDTLSATGALAYWLNLYNAGAVAMAIDSLAAGDSSVFRTPGRFTTTWATVADEDLSLDHIEHGKIRRFGDPRIHGALVCGSASCPTLRYEPYVADRLDTQLTDQMASFLSNRGLMVDREAGTVHLSRIFRWYGADFARPHRMPSLLPASRPRILSGVLPWVPTGTRSWIAANDVQIEFQPYDWSLACNVR